MIALLVTLTSVKLSVSDTYRRGSHTFSTVTNSLLLFPLGSVPTTNFLLNNNLKRIYRGFRV